MAPLKFEENIRQKLEQRKIQPSAGAWERIDKDLDGQKPQKSKPKWLWLAVAASFVGILILDGTFFDTNKPQNDPPIVNIPSGDETLSEDNPKKEKLVQEETIPQSEIEDRPFGEKLPTSKSKRQTPTDDPKLAENSEKNNPALTEAVKPNKDLSEDIVTFEDPTLKRSIDREINALLDTVDSLKQQNRQVSDADIDVLLAQAQQKLLAENAIVNRAENLSATALLQEAEGELDRSFRDRIFDALRKGYLKTRDALASRND